MSRRNKNKGQTVSLFPFLSVLACVIGVLTMLISVLSLLQVDPGEIEDLQRAEAAQKLRLVLDEQENKLKDEESELDELRRKLAEAALLAQSIEDAKKALADLQDEHDANRKLSAAKKNEIISLLAELKRLRELVAQAKKDLLALGIDISDLDEKIKDAKPPQTLTKILPPGEGGGGRGGRSKFIFVDIRPNVLRVHEAGKSPIVIKVSGRLGHHELTQHPGLSEVLERIYKSNGGLQLVQFIRPAAKPTEVARLLVRVARNKGVLVGKLPAVDDGPLDLTAFGIPKAQTAYP